ncbi:hypothetical protein Q8W71_19960 [Methylobacterium sp. NEAU 140]|uniref:hypothetical protein n=1 Tax=Methylobacterium sp. NEAU 140 TaxID=3064945 RepID=UPI00273265E5|nr:hypothetical protein [Methylobacterium sp. NEAU 140]MDP4024910.1 hypothetical protein [Methylobacterium sp. NEAU 140]
MAVGSDHDEDAIDALIGDFRGKRFDQVPPDPRTLDVARLRALRERLANPYAYRWREREADAELVDALYHTIAERSGRRWGLCVDRLALDDDGNSPPIYADAQGRANTAACALPEYRVRYYVTACSVTVRPFIRSYDAAVALLGSLLPGYGFTLRCRAQDHAVRLERDGYEGPWIVGPHAAVAIVMAALEHLERSPGEAAPWRAP